MGYKDHMHQASYFAHIPDFKIISKIFLSKLFKCCRNFACQPRVCLVMRSESACRLGRLDQLTDSLPAHANSSGSASETCRCVLLPSAQTPFNDLSTTASPPVHANSSDSASKTCRCVFLPSAPDTF
jgi:hypothetical protein